VTGQEAFTTMIRDVLAPALRAAGFRGSGRRFVLPGSTTWLVVGIQKSRWNDATEVSFTVNLTAADRAAWSTARATASWLPEAPSGIAIYPVGRTIRIGALLPPDRQDRWWTVRGGADPTRVGEEVAAAILGPGLAWFRSQPGTADPGPADQTS
jgi:hypothetical protein